MNSDFEILQHDWEFTQLLLLAGRPKRVLELGVWQGGTLRQWADIGGSVVGVDMALTENARRLESARVTLFEGNTHDPQMIRRCADLGPYDVVFVDADHAAHAAREDWQNYSGMVKAGGIFAFHDIRRTEHATLDGLWSEIKSTAGMKTTEFNHPLEQWGGIGVVHF